MILVGIPPFDDWNKYIKNNNIIIDSLSSTKKINRIILRNNINIIIPLSYQQMKFLSENFVKYFCLCPNNYDIVCALDNKSEFVLLAKKYNFEQYLPNTYVANDDRIEYPCILKPCVSCGGNGINLFLTELDKNETLKSMNNKKNLANYIIQEYIIDDYEYVGNFVVINGKIIFQMFFKQKYDGLYVKKQNMNNFEIICLNTDVFSKIFSSIKYTGAACVDFKIIREIIKIFEINPRFGGTFITNGYFMLAIDELVYYVNSNNW